MIDKIHNWRYNNHLVYTFSYHLSFEGPEYKLERRQKFTASRTLGDMNLLQWKFSKVPLIASLVAANTVSQSATHTW